MSLVSPSETQSKPKILQSLLKLEAQRGVRNGRNGNIVAGK